jgi:hypothetical protein
LIRNPAPCGSLIEFLSVFYCVKALPRMAIESFQDPAFWTTYMEFAPPVRLSQKAVNSDSDNPWIKS